MPEDLKTTPTQTDSSNAISVLSNLGLPYVWIPYLVIDFYGPAMGRAGWLYTVLTRLADHDTKIVVKYTAEDIGKLCGCDRDTVSSGIKRLEALGLIKKIPGDRAKTNEYMLIEPVFPAPDHIVAEYFPAGWQPSKSALLALQKSGLQSKYTHIPQVVGANEACGNIPHEDKSASSVPKISPDAPNNSARPSGNSSQSSREISQMSGKIPQLINKQSFSKTNEPEETFVRSLWNIFLTKSPNTSFDRFEELWFKTLNLFEDNEAIAQERFKNGVLVVEQSKTVKDPEGLLWKAIDNGWMPRPPSEKPKAPPVDDQKQIEEEYDKQLRAANLEAPIEKILGSLEFFKLHDKQNDYLETVRKMYQGNPNLEEAIKRFKQGGD
jgi:hypothetical protein